LIPKNPINVGTGDRTRSCSAGYQPAAASQTDQAGWPSSFTDRIDYHINAAFFGELADSFRKIIIRKNKSFVGSKF
jgi:hypothetical protein